MGFLRAVVCVSLLFNGLHGAAPNSDCVDPCVKIPDGLLIGAGLSASQSEGAWDTDGKAESLMDRMTHKVFNETIDVAADHYHRFKEDLAYAKELNFTSHRFSISWSRVLPSGDAANPNEKGVDFYKKLIKEIKDNGMEPFVTMLHFDQPFSLENKTNGWNSQEMMDKFVAYADFLFKTFGSEVKYWTTINEGNMYCSYFPQLASFIGLNPGDGNQLYRCLHNMVVAHVRVYRLYKEKYFEEQKGQVGASALMWPATPATSSYDDVVAADLFNQVYTGALLNPIVHGDWPPLVRYIVDKRSFEDLKLNESRLPRFTDEEKEMFRDGPAADFIAVNVYSGYKTAWRHNASDGSPMPSLLGPFTADMPNIKLISGGGFDASDENLMRDALLWTWFNYQLPIVISENGFGDTKHVGVNDIERAAYHSTALRSLIRTMQEYNVPVISYYAWALFDVFEFSGGYKDRTFGIIHIDYQSVNLTRTPKDSFRFFKTVGTTRTVPFVPRTPSSTAQSTGPALLSILAILVPWQAWCHQI
ncbi:uncharacterized protein LOC113213329 [Frankliniella occidentalis]|uniref:beta-glucosidase n=1 Tax=Frankliniella occidentalis TaxID=133901 RepID=A0A6J1TBI8_FRAOC|nr:uncharacterized protein LOC113213329 [Frankliniella occidentalis]